MNENEALISIIIPNYNNEKYLKVCLDSVLRQTYNDIEIIIVDDASTDGSLVIIEEYMSKHSCIRLIRNEKNQGVSNSRHSAIIASRGAFFTTLDSDDFYLDSRKIEKEFETIQAYGPGTVAFSNIILVDDNGDVLPSLGSKAIKEGDILIKTAGLRKMTTDTLEIEILR